MVIEMVLAGVGIALLGLLIYAGIAFQQEYKSNMASLRELKALVETARALKNFMETEGFIDQVVERINRKQLERY